MHWGSAKNWFYKAFYQGVRRDCFCFMLVSVSFWSFFLFCLGFCVLLVCCFVFIFLWMYYLLRTRRISSKFLGINVRFRETRWCRRFVASVFVCFFNECIVCWGRAVFCRRFLELVFVFGKRIVVAVVLFYLLRLFVFKEKMLLEEVGLRLSERFVNF